MCPSDSFTLLEKILLHPGFTYRFGDHSYSICSWGLKAGWLAGFMSFLCIVCTVLFNVYFGKHADTFIDTGEIGCICSLVILQAAPSWWRCHADEKQGLPEHGEVWHNRLGSGNAPAKITGEVSIGKQKRRFGTTVKSSPDSPARTLQAWPLSLKHPPGKWHTLSLPTTG